MTKTLKHGGVEYDLEKLLAIKGQGIVLKTNSTDCFMSNNSIISSETTKPIVVKQGNQFLILVESSHEKKERSFEVILVSKHILKKAKIEVEVVKNNYQPYVNQNPVIKKSPWILTPESARALNHFN